MKIVRFAPSPTGHLHIGGVRTALFNYLFAKNFDDQFILRIEDTDVSRSSGEMAQEIITALKWLGIKWKKGPFYQSHRFEKYKEAAFKLLEEKRAYRCFCTPQEIEQRRKTTGMNEKIFKYERQCFRLTDEQIDLKLRQKIPFVIRFLIPEGKTFYKDAIHKEMSVDNCELEDFVILKSDNSPTYHLAVVVDDCDMDITNVIRGDDHISNTFKQVLLFKALSLKPPKYAHLPLILGPDKKKLSKRHGETSVIELKKNGYLPEAIINYLSQLSWLPADTKKIFTLEELSKLFNFSKLAKNSPVFDYNKLRFINGKAIHQRNSQDIYYLLAEDKSFNEKYASFDKDRKVALIDLIKPRIKILAEFEAKFDIYLKGELNYNNKDFVKLNETYSNNEIKKNLKILSVQLETIEPFDSAVIEERMRECAEKNGLKAADLIHPSRFALTSEAVSPSIFNVFAFLGKEESIKRINNFIEYLMK